MFNYDFVTEVLLHAEYIFDGTLTAKYRNGIIPIGQNCLNSFHKQSVQHFQLGKKSHSIVD